MSHRVYTIYGMEDVDLDELNNEVEIYCQKNKAEVDEDDEKIYALDGYGLNFESLKDFLSVYHYLKARVEIEDIEDLKLVPKNERSLILVYDTGYTNENIFYRLSELEKLFE